MTERKYYFGFMCYHVSYFSSHYNRIPYRNNEEKPWLTHGLRNTFHHVWQTLFWLLQFFCPPLCNEFWTFGRGSVTQTSHLELSLSQFLKLCIWLIVDLCIVIIYCRKEPYLKHSRAYSALSYTFPHILQTNQFQRPTNHIIGFISAITPLFGTNFQC